MTTKSSVKSYFRNTISFTLVFALVCVGIISSVWSKSVYKTRTEKNPDGITENAGFINALLLGVDKAGYRTDVIIVAQLNLVDNSLSMLQIPRDTYVDINKNDKKINSSYLSVKNGQIVNDIDEVYREVEYVTGIKADNYLMVNTQGFRKIIDTIGGIDFDVPQRMKYDDPSQDLHIDLQKGFQHLDGDKAEQLVRFRGYAMADLERNKVQRDFIFAVIDKVFSLNGVTKIPELISIFSSSLQTNFTNAQMLQYAPFIMSLDKADINIMGLEGVAEYRHGVSYFIANDSLNKELVSKYFVDETTVNNNVNKDISKRDRLLSDDDVEAVSTDFEGREPGFFDKMFKKIQIIDGSGGTVDTDSIRKTVTSMGYNAPDVTVSDVSFPSSRIISAKENVSANAAAKAFNFENYVVSPDKAGNYDIVIVIGTNWNE